MKAAVSLIGNALSCVSVEEVHCIVMISDDHGAALMLTNSGEYFSLIFRF